MSRLLVQTSSANQYGKYYGPCHRLTVQTSPRWNPTPVSSEAKEMTEEQSAISDWSGHLWARAVRPCREWTGFIRILLLRTHLELRSSLGIWKASRIEVDTEGATVVPACHFLARFGQAPSQLPTFRDYFATRVVDSSPALLFK
jgi:hypothetical protein